MTEEWRPIDGFPDYEVSSHGRVRKPTTGRIAKLTDSGRGYLVVTLGRNKRWTTRYVHRLVAQAFCPPGGPVVRHLDGTRTNNVPSNLAWGTVAENAADTLRHGRNRNLNKTHCKRGHEFTPENTRLTRDGTGRTCKTCLRDQEAQRRAQRPPAPPQRRGYEITGRCLSGKHDMSEPAAYITLKGGRRTCRECHKASRRQWVLRRRNALHPEQIRDA